MELRLLGPVEVVGDAGVLDVGGPRAALLALLALAGRPVPEDELLRVLTPDLDQSAARRMLAVHLRVLADIVGQERLRATEHGVALCLDASNDRLDRDEFEAEAALGLEALAVGDTAGATMLLRGAVERWRGELADGLALPTWLATTADQLRLRRADVERALAEAERLPSMPSHPTSRVGGLPHGLVAFLLTDIVGSTRLWEANPSVMRSVLERHDEMMIAAAADAGGRLLKHRGEGDSTFSVFHRATDAVAAALASRRAIETIHLPDGSRLVARMAVHVGEAIERNGDYFGPTVNRAARIRSFATAGQVLLSQAAADSSRDSLPSHVALRPLGPHALRDIERPESLFLLFDEQVDGITDRVVAAPADAAWRQLPEPLAVWNTSFTGRAAETGTVARVLERARGRAGAVVAIGGEAGVGKTRLVAHASKAAFEAGDVVVFGRCSEDPSVSYQPFVHALRELIDAMPSESLEAYVGTFGGDLSRLVPALGRRVPWLPAPRTTDLETERHLLFDAVAGLLRHVASSSPLVFVVDDVQWADRPTLQLARYLLNETAGDAVTFMFTFRDDEVASNPPLNDLLADLRRSSSATVIALHGLTQNELAPLVAAIADANRESTRELTRRLHAETDGNPLFTVELLRHLVESYQAEPSSARTLLDLAPVGLPDNVRAVMRRRVERLGASASRVLGMAAVIGLDFDLDVLAAAVDADEGEVLDLLESAVGAHLVKESPVSGRFSFNHGLVVHALDEQLSPTRRARAHLQVAAALHGLYGDGMGPHLSDLTTHVLAAGKLADPVRATALARRAGDQALAQLAPDEAVRWYEAAAQNVPADGLASVELQLALGVAQREAGIPDFRGTLIGAANRARDAGAVDVFIAAALGLNRGDRARTYFVDDERVALLEFAVDLLRLRSDPQLARALAVLAQELIHDHDWRRRIALSDEALSIARETGDDRLLCDVLRLRFETIRLPDTLATRTRDAAELVEIAGRARDPLALAFGHVWCSRVALEMGDVNGLDEHAAQAWKLRDQVLNPFFRWNMSAHWVFRALMHGDLDESDRLAEECLQVARSSGQPDANVVRGDQRLTSLNARGRINEERERYERTLAKNPHLAAIRVTLALVAAEDGDIDRASELLDIDVVDRWVKVPRDNAWLACLWYSARAATVARHTEAATLLYEELAPWHDQVVWSGASTHGPLATALAELAALAGNPYDARRHALEGLELARRIGAPLWIAQALLAAVSVGALPAVALSDGAPTLGAHTGDDADAIAEASSIAHRHGFGGVERRALELKQLLQTTGGSKP